MRDLVTKALASSQESNVVLPPRGLLEGLKIVSNETGTYALGILDTTHTNTWGLHIETSKTRTCQGKQAWHDPNISQTSSFISELSTKQFQL